MSKGVTVCCLFWDIVYRPLRLRLSCEIIEKRDFGRPVVGGVDTQDFGHAFSNGTHFSSEHVAGFG